MNYIRGKNVRWRRELNTILVYDIRTREMIELNSVASEIWMLLNGENSIKQIGEIMFEKYKDDASKQEIIRDIDDLLNSLLDKSLIEING